MRFLFIFIFTVIYSVAQAQNISHTRLERIDAFYASGMELMEKDKVFEAGADFQRVLDLDPEHRDALYQLALVNERMGDVASAIRFLQRGMKLNDRRASRELVKRYHFQLSYADTMQNIEPSAREQYRSIAALQVLSLADLAGSIMAKTAIKREQLQLFLLWTYEHMNADSVRFFQGGSPVSTDEAFARRIGLCDEYSSLMNEFCKAAGIPTFKIPGYVKYPTFKAGDTFTEANHAWNAVWLDSSWLLCDVFWSTVALVTDGASDSRFVRRLEPLYFLAIPGDFINHHLPADPVFQFSNNPVAFRSFTSKVEGLEQTVPKINYVNYQDSLKALSAMSDRDRELRMAYHAFAYNNDNANDLIVASYNYAVDVLSDNTSGKQEWQTARRGVALSLTIIDASPNEEIRALKASCKTALSMLDKRLAGK